MLGFVRRPRRPSAHAYGGIQETAVLLLLAAGLVLGFSVVMNFVEQNSVRGLLNSSLSPGNSHALSDYESVKLALEDQIAAKVGADKDVEVYLYHFVPEIRLSDLKNPDAIPRLAGVKEMGEYLSVSTLVARAWWVQKRFFFQEHDVHVTKFLIVPADRVGPAYGPPPGDLDFVADPAMIVDSQR